MIQGEVDHGDASVGGQLCNIFGLNPGIDQSSPIFLFTTDLSIDGAATGGTMIAIEASASATSGGVVVYPDSNAGANVTAPTSPGTSLSFTPLTITVAPPSMCNGDIDGNGTTDVFDFAILAANFGFNVPPGTNGDYDGSGLVDVFDFAVLAADFGCTG